MLDHDVDGYGQELEQKELISILISIDPELKKAAMIIRGSVSAGVHLKGTKPKKGKGFHIYIPVKDASTIPEYGKLLCEHLWLKGYGYAKPSSNGVISFRSAIEEKVFSGERIDIIGKPLLLDDNLEYTPPEIKVLNGGLLDTSKLKELTPKEYEKVANLKRIAGEEIKSLARKLKSEWKKNRVPEISEKMLISKEEAKKLVDDFLKDNSNLYGKWPLYFDNGDVVSVVEVLKNPTKYDGLSLADPLDGVNIIKKGKAKFWWNNGKPIIHSFAHGADKNYFLSDSKNKLYIDGVKPYYKAPEYITKEDAQKKIQKVIRKWMNSGDEHFAIAAPAGIGKTMMIAKEVANYANDNLVEIYVPTHQLANEIREKILAKNNRLKVTVIKGRTYFYKENEEVKYFCKKHNLIEEIQSFGYNIYKDVCMTCPFESGELMCDYLKQFSDDAQVRIYNHKHLRFIRKLDKKLPAKAIIDERFFTDLIEVKQIELRHIEHFISNDFGLSNVICNALELKKPLLADLRRKYPDNLDTVIANAQNKLSENTLPEIDANTDHEFIKDQLKTKKVKITRLLSTMLDQITSEIELFPEREDSISVRKVGKAIAIVKRLEIKRFNNKDNKTPVLCIDADYSQKVASLFLPGITNLKIAVRRYAEVCQIYSTTNAKTRFFPNKKAINIKNEIEVTKEYVKNIQLILDNIYNDYGPFFGCKLSSSCWKSKKQYSACIKITR